MLLLTKKAKMKVKQIANRFLPPIVVDGIRLIVKPDTQRSSNKVLDAEKEIGFSDYENRRKKIIENVIGDEKLLGSFCKRELLPSGYGIGIDERCIEYPWLFANFADKVEIMLDAGSTLNYDFILNSPLIAGKVIHILTLAPEENCFWKRGISYLFQDLRDIPIIGSYYDTVVCLSTLEHIGCDNTIYTQNGHYHEDRCDDFLLVMKELRRVLKPGGTLFLTVPFGIYQHFGWFQQFDEKLLSAAVGAFGKLPGQQRLFIVTLSRVGSWLIQRLVLNVSM